MANPSRTTWADYLGKAPKCAVCGQRVTLKQAHRQEWDERTRTGRVIHAVCGRTASVLVSPTRAPLTPPKEASD